MFENTTDRGKKVFKLAAQKAELLDSDEVDTRHVLLGLIGEGSGVAANVLKNLGLTYAILLEEFKSTPPTVDDALNPNFLIMKHAKKAAKNLNHNYVGTEHILLGLLKLKSCAACQSLKNLEIDLEQASKQTYHLLGYEDTPEDADEKHRQYIVAGNIVDAVALYSKRKIREKELIERVEQLIK